MDNAASAIAATVDDALQEIGADQAVERAMQWDPRTREIAAAENLWFDLEMIVWRQNNPDKEPTPEDMQTVRDTFDGATTLDTMIRRTLMDSLELSTVAPGIDLVIKNLEARKERANKAILYNRGIIEKAMITARWKKQKFDIATVSVRPATAQIEITDESAVPVKYFKRPDPVIDKATLKADVMLRYKAMVAALEIEDEAERSQAIAKVTADFGPELPGCNVKIDGYTTTIKWA